VSFIGPGISLCMIWLPPIPSSGRTATARTIVPIPPSHCNSTAPKVDRRRQLVEPRQYGRTRSGEGSHCLEVGVCEIELGNVDQQGQRWRTRAGRSTPAPRGETPSRVCSSAWLKRVTPHNVASAHKGNQHRQIIGVPRRIAVQERYGREAQSIAREKMTIKTLSTLRTGNALPWRAGSGSERSRR